MNLPAAGLCLRAENSELRVLAPSRLRSFFHTRAESLGCHPEACRSLCPSPKQKRARSRTHHPTRWLPSSHPQLRRRKSEKEKPPSPRRCSRGDPQPAALTPNQFCLTAEGGGVGSARRRPAPRELLPGRGPGAAKTGAGTWQG